MMLSRFTATRGLIGLAALAVCGASLPATWLLNVAPQGTASDSPESAFTLQTLEVSELVGSGTPFRREVRIAKRSDGATVLQATSVAWSRREVLIPREKLRVVIADHQKLKTTYDSSKRPGGSGARSEKAADCNPDPQHSAALGTEMILGYRTYRYPHSYEQADGTMFEQHSWLSPDLGCIDLRTEVHRRRADGTLIGTFQRTAINVQRGEPDPSLFFVPADYREVRPSEFEDTVLRDRVGQERGPAEAQRFAIPRCMKDWVDVMDRRYAALTR